jgi:hypothetical protein
MVNRRYLQNKKLLGRRRLSCISFDPMGAWLQRILPPRTTSYLLYLKYIVFIPFCKGFLYFCKRFSLISQQDITEFLYPALSYDAQIRNTI